MEGVGTPLKSYAASMSGHGSEAGQHSRAQKATWPYLAAGNVLLAIVSFVKAAQGESWYWCLLGAGWALLGIIWTGYWWYVRRSRSRPAPQR